MGAHYASINNKNQNLGNRPFSNIVERECGIIINELSQDKTNETTICMFSKLNPANAPNKISDMCFYFSNEVRVTNKFRRLNNKKSAI